MSPSLCSDAVEFTLQNTLRGHTKPINHLAISPDKTRLISIGAFLNCLLVSRYFAQEWLADDSRAVVWSVASGEKLFVVERPFNGAATAVSWASRDGNRFVIGFASGDLHLFWSESEKVIKVTWAWRRHLILTTLSRTVTTSAYQGGRGLLRASRMTQPTTALLPFVPIRLNCGGSKGLKWLRFFHCRLYHLEGMANLFNFVTTGQA